MIRLLIDSKEVSLSEGTSFVMLRENPFIQKAGDFSYDVDIDLHDKDNAKLYSGMKRLQHSFPQLNRTIELYDGMRLLLRGVEVILSIDDEVAKIQIVGNASQMNYEFDDTIHIREMNLGQAYPTVSNAKRYTRQFYGPTVHEAYPIIVKRDDDVETFILDNTSKYNYPDSFTEISFPDDADLMPQPYLLFIIDRIIEMLGYHIGVNDINIQKYKHLIIVQNYSRTLYAKMLPDWTLAEFLTEIEKFFNVVFEFNSLTKAVDIVSVSKFYSQRAETIIVSHDKVLDSFQVELSDDTTQFQTDYNNVGYQLPSSGYWKTQNLDEQVIRTSTFVNKVWEFTKTEGAEYSHTIFYDNTKDIQYIQREDTAGIAPFLVNQFADIKQLGSTSQTTLRIRPAKICSNYYLDDEGTHIFISPTVSEFEQKPQKFLDYITNREEEKVDDCINVAFFLGNINEWDNNGNRDVFVRKKCQCTTTYWYQMNNILGSFNASDLEGYDKTYTLRLTGTFGRFNTEFSNGISIDTTHVFHFRFIDNRFLDPRSIFIIGGRKFYCRRLQYTAENCNFSHIVEGEFFPAL